MFKCIAGYVFIAEVEFVVHGSPADNSLGGLCGREEG